MKHYWSMPQHGPSCLDMGQRLWSRKDISSKEGSLLTVLKGQKEMFRGKFRVVL